MLIKIKVFQQNDKEQFKTELKKHKNTKSKVSPPNIYIGF